MIWLKPVLRGCRSAAAGYLRFFDVPGPDFNYLAAQPGAKVRRRKIPNWIERTMMDLIFIAVVVLFFVVSGWYVRFCDKM